MKNYNLTRFQQRQLLDCEFPFVARAFQLLAHPPSGQQVRVRRILSLFQDWGEIFLERRLRAPQERSQVHPQLRLDLTYALFVGSAIRREHPQVLINLEALRQLPPLERVTAPLALLFDLEQVCAELQPPELRSKLLELVARAAADYAKWDSTFAGVFAWTRCLQTAVRNARQTVSSVINEHGLPLERLSPVV